MQFCNFIPEQSRCSITRSIQKFHHIHILLHIKNWNTIDHVIKLSTPSAQDEEVL